MAGKCIGILREVFNTWERRVPLCPSHVKKLSDKGVRVLIQPSNTRIFPDNEYKRVGAEVTDDLSPASLIMGVKQVETEAIRPDLTYMFFSHTIKGQKDNMPLLDKLLEQKATLVDYECIKQGGKVNGRRLVAFGDYAGKAGLIDFFRGFGERLLNIGYSTPFLNVGSAYMYPSLAHGYSAVATVGQMIKQGTIPKDLAPLTFCFIGDGNVSRGAQEVFRLLPHQMVNPEELPHLPKEQNMVFGSVIHSKDVLLPRDGGSFDAEDYYAHPERYRSIFHEKVAPYSSVLVNARYWDHRCDRLLTIKQAQAMWKRGQRKLIGVADLSADPNGSIEFFTKCTSSENPFFLYDIARRETRDELTGEGVVMLGVDNIPCEVPTEASQHFGDQVVDYIPHLLEMDKGAQSVNDLSVPEELRGAMITYKGELTPTFKYIENIRSAYTRSDQVEPKREKEGVHVHLHGDLFDSMLVNKVLDLVEEAGGRCKLEKVEIGFVSIASTSMVVIEIILPDKNEEKMETVLKNIKLLAELTPGANATMKVLEDYDTWKAANEGKRQKSAGKSKAQSAPQSPSVSVRDEDRRQILVLGAGLVAEPAIEFLSRDERSKVNVVSAVPGQAQSLVQRLTQTHNRNNVEGIEKDVFADGKKYLETSIQKSEVVLSLLPATLHHHVAEFCMGSDTDLVTASYVSDEMKKMNETVKEKGLRFMCEMGLDPGMDHMSAMQLISQANERGGEVVSFSSYCGGLPAPEAANNPLRYKFSWSPRGVLTAAQNAATFLQDGKVVEVAGSDMLSTARPAPFFPTLRLEFIPNRNSLPYGEIYGIDNAKTIYRGTLRFEGCCQIMHGVQRLGLLDPSSRSLPSDWATLLQELNIDLAAAPPDSMEEVFFFLRWLGLENMKIDPRKASFQGQTTVLDAFCAVLQEKLALEDADRDMVVMHNEVVSENPEGRREKLCATLIEFGDPMNKEGALTAMARTVGLTAAMGVKLSMEGAVKERGVLRPTLPSIYSPSINWLEEEGIKFRRSVELLS